MTLKCISSSSKGNCYLLTSQQGATLVLECGVPMAEIKKALNYDISGIVGCVVTHEHNDHAKSIKGMMECGIRCLALEDVFKAKKCKFMTFAVIAEHKKAYRFGDFKVSAFSVRHDVPCLCYVIEHPEMGKLLFCTDTFMLPYRFKGLTRIMIECNYADDILQANMDAGICPHSLRDRLMTSHMELETCKEAVKANVCAETQSVLLLHLSADNATKERFWTEVSSYCGVPTSCASKGMISNYDKNPY